MDEDEDKKDDGDAGAPAWVMTFADLMSLLMCFFVLLLSFAEMDIKKFKQIAGSLKMAFGVQREIKASEIPKGTSIIAREFSPGRPDNTLLQDIRQQTTEEEKDRLDMRENKPTDAVMKDAKQIEQALAQEIEAGKLEIETEDQKIIIRILEQGAFPSGEAEFKDEFAEVMAAISAVLASVKGKIEIEGHTDNIPIKSKKFRSNWDLSSARASTVAHSLLEHDEINPRRLTVSGFADTKPRKPNDTKENRGQNRRVEIVIIKGDDVDGAEGPVPAEELENILPSAIEAPAADDGIDPFASGDSVPKLDIERRQGKVFGTQVDVELWPHRPIETETTSDKSKNATEQPRDDDGTNP